MARDRDKSKKHESADEVPKKKRYRENRKKINDRFKEVAYDYVHSGDWDEWSEYELEDLLAEGGGD